MKESHYLEIIDRMIGRLENESKKAPQNKEKIKCKTQKRTMGSL